MEYSDTLLIIASHLDNPTLNSLFFSSLREIMSSFIGSQHFWYRRVENLLERYLPENKEVDWKNTYYILQSSVGQENKFTDEVLSDSFSTRLLLELRYDPSLNHNLAIKRSSLHGYTEAVSILLSDCRVNPSCQNNYSIRIASECGHTAIVSILLKDERVDPSDLNNYCIITASSVGMTEVVSLLLKDPRIDPLARGSSSLYYSCYNGHSDVVTILLQDGRVNPNGNECMLRGSRGISYRSSQIIARRWKI